MKTNTIPNSRPQLTTLAIRALAGAEAHGATTGLVHYTATQIRSAVEDYIGVAGALDPSQIGGKQHAFCAARGAASAAIEQRNEAIENGRDFCALAVAILKRSLGRKWSAEWGCVGFAGPSLAIPAAPAPLLRAMATYFAEHPEKEVASLEITAAGADAQVAAIVAATLAAANARGARGAAKRGRDLAAKKLRQVMVGLRGELALLLGSNDGRWLRFGFQNPAQGRVPKPVEDVRVESVGPGAALVQWAGGSRGAKVRVRWQAAGGEWVDAGLFAGTSALLRDLPLGAAVTIGVTARNRSGETLPVKVQFAVPSDIANR